MPIYRVIVCKSNDQHEKMSVLKDKNTPKAAYEYGQELGVEVFGLGIADLNVEIEEQPAVV